MRTQIISTVALMLFSVLFESSSAWSAQINSRRGFLTTAGGIALTVSLPANAVDSSLLEDLRASKAKMEPIPDLLEKQDWEAVRQILKTPPVNKLWNLGDSQNTVLKLAKETGNVELFEVKEDLALDLQICDQLTYANAFVYFQPGDGKYKIKEPQEMARAAMTKITQALEMANE